TPNQPVYGLLKLGRCSIQGDKWPEIGQKIDEADVLIFVSPIYFHHVARKIGTLCWLEIKTLCQ
ncbi:MAG: NAD(P)H-dependent oxidoreductase, partial [Bacteroidota bacterium]